MYVADDNACIIHEHVYVYPFTYSHFHISLIFSFKFAGSQDGMLQTQWGCLLPKTTTREEGGPLGAEKKF